MGRLDPFSLVAGAALLVLLVVVVYPSGVLVLNSFLAGGTLSLANWARVLADAETGRVLLNSLTTAGLATVLATGLGVGLAWLTARTDLPGRRFFRTALVVPYLIPPFIGGIAWIYLLGPVGYLNRLWQALSGAPDPLVTIYGPAGVTFVLALYSYPIAYVLAQPAFARMHGALEGAARIAGAGPYRALVDITLPLLLPTILAAAALVFMSALANFGIPAVIGFPAKFYVLTTRIYATVLNFDQRDHLQLAAALSLLLVVVAAAVLLLQGRLLARRGFTVIGARGAEPLPVVPLGPLRWPLCLALCLFVLVAAVLPVGAVALTSLTRIYGLPLGPANLTLANWETLLTGLPAAQRALGNSFLLAAGAATLIALLGLLLAYLLVPGRLGGLGRGTRAVDHSGARHSAASANNSGWLRGGLAGVIETLIALPYAVPGTVVALAMILAWIRPLPLLEISIYNTIWILLVAYVARFLAFGVRAAGAALRGLDPALEEAARVAGRGALGTLRDIVLPLLRPSLAGAWFLVFIPAFSELTLSVLLWSVGNETIGVMVFSLHEQGKILLSAALATLLTAFVLLVSLAARRLTGDEIG